MKILPIITYLLLSSFYIVLFAYRKEILNGIKETCNLIYTAITDEVEDDN